MAFTLLSTLTLVSSALAAVVPFTTDSAIQVANLAIRPDMTELEIYQAWTEMGDMLQASGENQDVALVACKGVCFDWNLSASACSYPDHTQSEFIVCMCNKQNLDTMPPCTDCLANQNSKPEYRQQTSNFLDLCETLNYSLQNATKSSIFFDELPTSSTATSALATPTLTRSTTSASPSVPAISDDGALGGGLSNLTLSTDLLTASTSTSQGRNGIAATATSISNQGEAKVTDKAENGAGKSKVSGGSALTVSLLTIFAYLW